MYNVHPLLTRKMSGKPTFGAAGLAHHFVRYYIHTSPDTDFAPTVRKKIKGCLSQLLISICHGFDVIINKQTWLHLGAVISIVSLFN